MLVLYPAGGSGDLRDWRILAVPLRRDFPMRTNIKLGRGTKLLNLLPTLPALLLGTAIAHAADGNGIALITPPPPPRTMKVVLGTAGEFVILSETGITDVPTSAVTGNIGVSPTTGAADHLSCSEVTGRVLSVDADGPSPCNRIKPAKLTTAISDMQAAYSDAAGRTATFINVGSGNIGGLVLRPGVYAWNGAASNVSITSNVTLRGNSIYDKWIFQIPGTLTVASGAAVVLGGEAQAQHIYWQVAGATTLGTTSHLEGTVLDMTSIALGTHASINGRLLAQTAVTLQMSTVTQPPPLPRP
jgi:hypothetical protein